MRLLNNRNAIIPTLALIFFLGSESFLKASVPNSNIKTLALILGVISWLFLMFYFWRDSELWQSFSSPTKSSRQIVFAAILIIFAGFVFRFWRLGSLADGMAWDEAYKGLDALAIRNYGERPIFLDWNAGREALIAYLVAASQSIFDYSIVSVRAVLAFFGSLTLIVFFFLCKRLFNLRIATLATFLIAVSKWHIMHSRYAVRVSLIVFFEVLVLLLLARAIQSEKRNNPSFVAAGLFGGLGLYTYIAYRIFPLIAAVFLLDSRNRNRLIENWKGLAAGLFASFLIAAPLLNFYWANRESFNDRIKRTAVWNTRGTELSPVELIADSTIKTLGLFTYRGDAIDRHNLKEEPMLSPFSSGLFLLGIGITLINIRKPYAAFLMIYFVLTILPGILSVQAPHSSRTLGSVIPAILFVTIGLAATIRMIAAILPMLATVFLSAVLGANFYSGPNDGLLRYAETLDNLDKKTSAIWGIDRDQYRVAVFLNQLGTRIDPYLSAQFYFHSTIEYLTYSKSAYKLYGPGLNLQETWKQKKIALIIVQPAECNLWWLRDDDRKRFFKWWAQSGPYDVKRIRGFINRSYVNSFRTMNMSDWRVIEAIRKNYPEAREVRLDSFTVFLIAPPKRPGPADAGSGGPASN